MKRPTLLLMSVILASIFLFFLLNLLLGSVHIPFRSVWNIDGIGGGSGAIGEWFADADGFPESAGRTVGIGY